MEHRLANSTPPRLVAVILRALRQSMRAARCGEAEGLMGRDRQMTIAAVEAGPTADERGLLSIPVSTDSAQECRDRNTGLPLTHEMVQKARELVMQYMDELKVLAGQRLGHVHGRHGPTADPDRSGRHRQGRLEQAQLQEQAGLPGDAPEVNN